MGIPASLLPLVLVLQDTPQPPEDEEVVAGWTAFALFLGLCLAVALLCWSMARQLKKVRAAREAGVYGPEERDEPAQREATEPDAQDEAAPDQQPRDQQ